MRKQLNEKEIVNQKLYSDNSNMFQYIDKTNYESESIKGEINQAMAELDNQRLENSRLQNTIEALENRNRTFNKEMNDIKSANDDLSKDLIELQKQISRLTREKEDYGKKIDYLNVDLAKQSKQIGNKEEQLNYSAKQLLDTNKELKEIKQKLVDEQVISNRLRADLENIGQLLRKEKEEKQNSENIKESCIRMFDEKERDYKSQIDGFYKDISSKDKQISSQSYELQALKNMSSRYECDTNRLQIDIDKLKQHIMLLTEQNENVFAFILAFL